MTNRYKRTSEALNKNESFNPILIILILALLTVVVVGYWPTIADLFKELQRDDDYSAGLLVPFIAVFLVWRKRKELGECSIRPFWPGLLLLLIAQAGRFFGLMFVYESAERYSIVLTVIALVLMVAGLQVFKKLLWVLLFLFMVVPFPGRIHNMISGPLQRMSTDGAVFLLEAFGVRVSQQGNVVTLNENVSMAVVEACGGLRMLTAFIIVAAFMAFMVNRSRPQKTMVLASSIPIAVLCNIFRLCVTALLFLVASEESAEKFFHDFAGIVMMPCAVMLIFG